MKHIPANPVVWTEIKVSDLDAAMAFYGTVFDFDVIRMEDGPMPSAHFAYDGESGVSAQLMEGKPATAGTGPVLHMLVPDTVEAAIKRLEVAGGTVTSPIITIPPGRFAYASDPDGNSIGLFQPKG